MSTSSADFTLRAASSSACASARSADGNVNDSNVDIVGVSASTPMVCARASPGMVASRAVSFDGFHVIGYRCANGMSAGTPSSLALNRCTSPPDVNTQLGANARAPASHNRRAPDT